MQGRSGAFYARLLADVHRFGATMAAAQRGMESVESIFE